MSNTPPKFIGYGRQYIDDADIEAVARVLRGDFLTQGPATQDFENALQIAFDAPFATACNSGTAALHMAAIAMGLGPGDVVIVPAITFAATANAVLYTGADVVFADCNANNGLMELSHVQEALARVPAGKTAKAVFCVHLNGQCTDMPALYDFCKSQNLFLLEDACHAIGTTYENGLKIGSARHSDVAVFSFHPVKTIAMGEGGAVLTRRADWAALFKMLVTHGITKKPNLYKDQTLAVCPWYHEMQVLGWNYRPSDIQSALGLSQLQKLPFFAEERRKLMSLYKKSLEALQPVVKMVSETNVCNPVCHLNAVLIDYKAVSTTRTEIMNELKAHHIGTQVHYIPVYQHPYYQDRYQHHMTLEGAQKYYDQVLSLPLYVGMTPADVTYVVGTLQKLLMKEKVAKHAVNS